MFNACLYRTVLSDADLQCCVPLFGEFGAAPDRLAPNEGKVGDAAEILSDGNGVVQIQYHMPPATWNEDRLSRTLQYLQLQQQ